MKRWRLRLASSTPHSSASKKNQASRMSPLSIAYTSGDRTTTSSWYLTNKRSSRFRRRCGSITESENTKRYLSVLGRPSHWYSAGSMKHMKKLRPSIQRWLLSTRKKSPSAIRTTRAYWLQSKSSGKNWGVDYWRRGRCSVSSIVWMRTRIQLI